MRINRKTRRKISLIVLVIFFSMSIVLFLLMRQLNKTFLPTVVAISNLTVQSKINEAILNSVQYTITDMGLTAQDFYKKNDDNISVNTMLVNEICAEIAVHLSQQLTDLGPQKITIPLGIILGIDFLASLGPKYSFVVLPMGNATVDYETSFESVGINQVKFELWIDVESTVQIVNPLQDSALSVKRKVAIVNTVISGEIPNLYLENVK